MTTDIKHEAAQNASHAAGPWTAGHNLVMCGSSMIAQVFAGGDRVPGQTRKETRQANARLIAAAPRLLDALEVILEILPSGTQPWEANAQEVSVREIARFAIAEAKGQAA